VVEQALRKGKALRRGQQAADQVNANSAAGQQPATHLPLSSNSIVLSLSGR
jgi:hypothetical protein